MDYQLHYGDNLGVDVTLQLLRLNPQIYKHFPKSKREWDGMTIKNKSDSEAKYIPCVNQTTTIRDYRSKSGDMYLVYDRHDSERRTHLTTKTLKTYRPSVEYTTAWFVTDSDYSAAVVRMNSGSRFRTVCIFESSCSSRQVLTTPCTIGSSVRTL